MVARSCLADAVYRALLRLYPLHFQQDFASDMALDFADASDEAWQRRRWRGVAGIWTRAAADLAGSLTVQWVRTGIPLIALLSVSAAVCAASAALTLVPQEPLPIRLPQRDQELAMLLLLAGTVFLIIAATIIFSVWFLLPLLRQKASGAARRRNMPELKRGHTSKSPLGL